MKKTKHLLKYLTSLATVMVVTAGLFYFSPGSNGALAMAAKNGKTDLFEETVGSAAAGLVVVVSGLAGVAFSTAFPGIFAAGVVDFASVGFAVVSGGVAVAGVFASGVDLDFMPTARVLAVLDLNFFLLLEGFFAMLHSFLRSRSRGLDAPGPIGRVHQNWFRSQP